MSQKTSSGPSARIAEIAPAGDLRVNVTWSKGPRANRTEEIDLSPIINSMKLFRPLRDNPDLFATVRPIDYGMAVAWGNDDDDIDLSAGAILRLSEETMRPSDMRTFIATYGFTETSLAAVLDYSRRQIVGFINEGRPIPRVVSLACRYIALVSPAPESHDNRQPTPGPHADFPPGLAIHGQASSNVSLQGFSVTRTSFATLSIAGFSSVTSASTLPQTRTNEPLRHAA